MKKIILEIVALSYSQTQTGAYALVLGEKTGNRKLPIIIGAFEAQAIAVEMEKMTPSRPLTHDLFKSLAHAFAIEVKEVIIYNLVEGVFYAKLICTNGTDEMEIDARTSDAIALAVRFDCPISTYEFILSTSGIVWSDNDENETNEEAEENLVEETKTPKSEFGSKTNDELNTLLNEAIEDEDYERASKIRDEINKRKSA